jgi:PAS domain S-box-containing protein
MVFRDISEFRRAEERLRRSETSLRSVLDAVMDGLSVTDDQLRIIQVNAVMEKWYPQASPLVGRLCHQVYHGLEKPCANCPSLKALETRERQSTVIPRTKGGLSTGWLELFSYPILDSEGRAMGVVEHIRDITDRVNAQDERERLIHRLEVQNEELERFAYTVSHDLKSPVITIKGFLGVVLKDLEIGRTDRLAVDLNRMGEAANHMGRLLDELLQLSRVGRVVTPPERVSMGRLVLDAVERVSGRLMQKPIRLLVEPTLPDVVVDRPRMVEALANLIDNAAKFMDNQEDPLIEIGHRREGGRIIYFVRDNGSGIEPRYLDRVFILFERLNPRIEGTGVGLALVKRVIETHGGRIWAQSDGPGRGATFSFTLGKPSDLDSPGSVVKKHVPPA